MTAPQPAVGQPVQRRATLRRWTVVLVSWSRNTGGGSGHAEERTYLATRGLFSVITLVGREYNTRAWRLLSIRATVKGDPMHPEERVRELTLAEAARTVGGALRATSREWPR